MQPPHRSASSQARTSSTPAGNQGRAPVAGNQKQAPQAGRPAPATKKKKQPKDRLGQAVVSLIFGIFGILMFIMSLFAMDLGSGYSYEAPAGAMFMMLLSFIVSLLGFVLGIRARRSPSGRGMAIAGITLTAIPVALMTITIILVIAIMYVGSQATIG